MTNRDLVIIGGGPAGLAAAIGAYDAGVRDMVILEREPRLGGILNQCVHNGFGLHTFKEELTGPEYAQRFIDQVKQRNIECLINTTVINVSKDKTVTYVNAEQGVVAIKAKAIIFACGCRERPRGAINIAGARCAGIYSAGTAQRLVNMEGLKPGNEVVILGSGDIGLIMARRMTFDGCHVNACVELMPYSSGLNRNIVQCLRDYNIPLMLSHTVTKINAVDGRLSSVVIAAVDEKLCPVPGTETEIKCDTLLLSVGLLPENELARGTGVGMSPITGGAEVDDDMMTNIDGVFECGNVLHVHDLVDFVSKESELAGEKAAEYISGGEKSNKEKVTFSTFGGVRYVVPQKINRAGENKELSLKMRVGAVKKNVRLEVIADGEVVVSKPRKVVTPGEMENLALTGAQVEKLRKANEISVGLNGGEQ